MIRYFERLSLGLLAAALTVACSDSGLVDSPALSGQAIALDVPLASEDPCALVLVPLASSGSEADSPIDRSIARYQNAASRASQPLHQLERLGWALVARARGSRDTGFYNLAEQTATCMESHSPDSPEALLLRGHVLHNLHRFAEAEVLARRLVGQRGLWFDFALLGDVLTERGDLNDAVDAYQMAVDLRPGPQVYARIAQLRWLTGDIDGAIEIMTKAARAANGRTSEPAAWLHVRLAHWLMQREEPSIADAMLERALTLHPTYPPALHARGRLRLAQNRLADAIPLLEQAVRLDPLPEFRWTLYEALDAAGLHNPARKQKSELLRSGGHEDRRTVALFLATLGHEPETALRLARRELALREDVFTLDAVAWALSGAGMNEEALGYSQRALAIGTQDARLFLHAGAIAARAGQTGQALELLNKAEATKSMLLPSERQLLAQEFTALASRMPAVASGIPPRREHLVFERR